MSFDPKSFEATRSSSESSTIVNGLAQLLREHDRTTAAHGEAVALLTLRLCAELDFARDFTVRAGLAARVHDLGMLRVSSGLLAKPGALTSAELAEIVQHPEHGARVLSAFRGIEHLAPIVRAHHERVDGTGYPDRLIGSEIPFEARIIAVADAFHAMTSARPYAAIRSPFEALVELQAGTGTHFESEVVGALCTLITSRDNIDGLTDLAG